MPLILSLMMNKTGNVLLLPADGQLLRRHRSGHPAATCRVLPMISEIHRARRLSLQSASTTAATTNRQRSRSALAVEPSPVCRRLSFVVDDVRTANQSCTRRRRRRRQLQNVAHELYSVCQKVTPFWYLSFLPLLDA